METPADLIENLYERAEAFSKTSYKLAKLKSLETTTVVATSLISWLSVAIIVSMFAMVLNIGVALWLGELLGKNYYGFFIVAGFYMVAGFIVYLFLHQWIKKPVSELIISQALPSGQS